MGKQAENSDQQLVFFSYIDKETGKVLAQDQATGQTGSLIKYDAEKRLAELGQQGYKLAYNGFPDGARYAENDQMNQVFAILLQHKRKTMTPDEAATQGVAEETERYSRHYTLTVNFVDEHGKKLAEPETQQITWRCSVTLDEATGKTVAQADGQWFPEKKQYTPVKAPVITGYLAGQSSLAGQPVAQQDLTSEVVYHSLGKIVPVLDDGQKVLYNQAVGYRNDPADASKVVAQVTPQIAGYTVNLQSVLPVDPLKNTKIIYEPVDDTSTDDDKQVVHHYTVHFRSEKGERLTADAVQDSIWRRDGSRNIKKYQDVKVPVIQGYYTIDRRLTGPVVVPFDINHTVVYRRLGKIIPIDEQGETISGAHQSVYQNDPADPTAPLADQPVPKLAGYVAEKTTITPDDGNLDTRVVYYQK